MAGDLMEIHVHPSPQNQLRALHGQQSAVHCLSSNCGRNFPQNSLAFALLRAFCF
jgi:hypothetical protein